MALPGLRRRTLTWEEINAQKAREVGSDLDTKTASVERVTAPTKVRAVNPTLAAGPSPIPTVDPGPYVPSPMPMGSVPPATLRPPPVPAVAAARLPRERRMGLRFSPDVEQGFATDPARAAAREKGIGWGTDVAGLRPAYMSDPRLAAVATADATAQVRVPRATPAGPGYGVQTVGLRRRFAEQDAAAADAANANRQLVDNNVTRLRGASAAAGAGDPARNRGNFRFDLAEMGANFDTSPTNSYARTLRKAAFRRDSGDAAQAAARESAAERQTRVDVAKAEAQGAAAKAAANRKPATAADAYNDFMDDPDMAAISGEIAGIPTDAENGQAAMAEAMRKRAVRLQQLQDADGMDDAALAESLLPLQTMTPEQRAAALKDPTITAKLYAARRKARQAA